MQNEINEKKNGIQNESKSHEKTDGAQDGKSGGLNDAVQKAGESKTSGSCCSTGLEKITMASAIKNIFSTSPKWVAERQLILFTAGSAIFLLMLAFFLYMGAWSSIQNFEKALLPLLALGAIASAVIVGVGYHFIAYKNPVSCEIGMMEGMTFGMMSGFLIGALVGASSGMFWGCVVGMLASCAIGVWAGKCCGVMGVIEGLMAGIMGGTMGAMISVMLLADPLIEFLILFEFLCLLVMVGLAYMRTVEYGRIGSAAKIEPPLSIASTCLIFFLLLSLFMVYGPKSGPVWLG
ncbi:hypothetical protein COU37_02650 [Candidatus Micrarchaeota archaeon CG10_big_fil_rev_8_21_14_0_10_45_29]|nr:MAG: hypothetical protein COU37_02650 [Candidatus Micrarchaeota archaeon CG10_big_fil_rev_8_21_14_0_10_45_29]